jgi:hypothetical protein
MKTVVVDSHNEVFPHWVEEYLRIVHTSLDTLFFIAFQIIGRLYVTLPFCVPLANELLDEFVIDYCTNGCCPIGDIPSGGYWLG